AGLIPARGAGAKGRSCGAAKAQLRLASSPPACAPGLQAPASCALAPSSDRCRATRRALRPLDPESSRARRARRARARGWWRRQSLIAFPCPTRILGVCGAGLIEAHFAEGFGRLSRAVIATPQ